MRLQLTAASSLLLTAALARDATACICSGLDLSMPTDAAPGPTGIEIERDQSAAVFEGTITALQPGPDWLRARVKVLRRWKAPDVQELVVGTSNDTCGFSQAFAVGQTWIFFARRDCDLLVVGNCSRTDREQNPGTPIPGLDPPLPPGQEVRQGGVTDGGKLPDATMCGPDATPPPNLSSFDLTVIRDLGILRDLAVVPDLAAPQLDAGGADGGEGPVKKGGCEVGQRGDYWVGMVLLMLMGVGLKRRRRS